MNQELDAYIARAQDPVLIPGIYNYCDSRCGRCPFTARCFTYREEQAHLRAGGERPLTEHLEANVTLTTALMQAWCERHGHDFERLQEDTQSEPAEVKDQRAHDIVDDDPLQIAACRYSKEAYAIVAPLADLSAFHDWPPSVGAAIDAIAWCSGMISAKLSRALHGSVEQGRFADEDPVQNDWNGSAKIVRLAIAESQDAWRTLFAAGQTPPDASIRRTTALLEHIDADVEERFPLAMEFVRPGFDEPDIADGALTRLAPFEPRHPRAWHRLRAWLSRMLRRRLGVVR
jgi:hypothetical protein